MYNYCDMMLPQEFQPIRAQLSLKAVLSSAEILATASDRCRKAGPWTRFWRRFPLPPIMSEKLEKIQERTLRTLFADYETFKFWDFVCLIS